MSRIEQAFQGLPEKLPLWKVALTIAERIADLQQQNQATIELVGDVVVQQNTRVTHLASHNVLSLNARGSCGQHTDAGLGLSATTISACPCMQLYALDDWIKEFKLPILDPREVISRVPVATHSQKGRINLFVSQPAAELKGVDIGNLYKIINDATHLTSELLKRLDEYELVYRSHTNPQFVEDVVRSTLIEVGRVLSAELKQLHIKIHAESYESIHGHDIAAEAEMSLADLLSWCKKNNISLR